MLYNTRNNRAVSRDVAPSSLPEMVLIPVEEEEDIDNLRKMRKGTWENMEKVVLEYTSNIYEDASAS